MDTFPNIHGCADISGGVFDPLLEDTFESGDDSARPEFTSPREQVRTLSWPAMLPRDYETLKAFHAAHRGVLFSWQDPAPGGAEWLARFVSDPLAHKASDSVSGRYAVTLKLKPVRRVVAELDHGNISDAVEIFDDYGSI